jgi:nucleotidyltransferase/DNA polymerase involved in DNA repair
MTQYEKVEDEFGSFIKRTTQDGTISFIPIDEANADYQTYLNPSEQSTPIVTKE